MLFAQTIIMCAAAPCTPDDVVCCYPAHSYHPGVEIGLVISIGLALLITIYESAFPHTAVLGKIPGTSVFRNVSEDALVTHMRLCADAINHAPIHLCCRCSHAPPSTRKPSMHKPTHAPPNTLSPGAAAAASFHALWGTLGPETG